MCTRYHATGIIGVTCLSQISYKSLNYVTREKYIAIDDVTRTHILVMRIPSYQKLHNSMK